MGVEEDKDELMRGETEGTEKDEDDVVVGVSEDGVSQAHAAAWEVAGLEEVESEELEGEEVGVSVDDLDPLRLRLDLESIDVGVDLVNPRELEIVRYIRRIVANTKEVGCQEGYRHVGVTINTQIEKAESNATCIVGDISRSVAYCLKCMHL